MTPLYDVIFRCVCLPCLFVEVSVVHDVIVLMLFMTSLYDVIFRCVHLPCFFVEVSVVHDVIV